METKPGRKFSPLWIALIIAAILIVIAYGFVFWSPGEPIDGDQVIPRPITAPQ